jgi:hypothetical protein
MATRVVWLQEGYPFFSEDLATCLGQRLTSHELLVLKQELERGLNVWKGMTAKYLLTLSPEGRTKALEKWAAWNE